MEEKHISIGLDNPIFAGRLRKYDSVDDKSATNLVQKRTVPQAAYIATQSKRSVRYADPEPEFKPSPIKFFFDDIEAEKPKAYKQKFGNTRRYRFISNSLIFLALILLCFGGYVAISGMRLNKGIQESHASAQSVQEGSDENKPSDEDLNNYKVGPTKPRFIKIDKFGVKARVRALGTNKNNQLQSPINVHDAGWYTDSALPGTSGASLIDGHVSGTTQHGVFWDLRNVVSGDIVTIERGDGKQLQYKVVAKESVLADKVDMIKVMNSKTPGKHGLNLITCTGQVHGHSYDQRLIVYTEFVK